MSNAKKNLKELGYDPGLAYGSWGKKTTSAVNSFQRDNGLPATEQLDKQTQAKLIITKPPSQVFFIL